MLVSAQANLLGGGLDSYEASFHLPPCYFSRPCGFCPHVPTLPVHVVAPGGEVDDCALPAQEVSQRDLKKLMDAHVRFGHRNFRSLAKALCLKLPSKMPFALRALKLRLQDTRGQGISTHLETLRLDLGLGFILILLDLFLTALLTVLGMVFSSWTLFLLCCGWTCSPLSNTGLTAFVHWSPE